MDDPNWPRASNWLKTSTDDLYDDKRLKISVVGAPLSQASITPNQSHETPQAIRYALRRFSTYAAGVGWPEEVNVDLESIDAFDFGDVALQGLENVEAQGFLEHELSRMRSLSAASSLWVILGGDNSITRPAMRALTDDLGRAGLLTLDAHHDVRDYYAGPSNGTPVRGLIDDGLLGSNVVQIGIGKFSNSKAYRMWAEAQGVTCVSVASARVDGLGICVERHLKMLSERCDVIFVDLDVDVLDSAFAPGCPGSRPGGITPSELHDAAFAAGKNNKVIGVDIVEVDAASDVDSITTDNAAMCLLSAAAGLAGRRA